MFWQPGSRPKALHLKESACSTPILEVRFAKKSSAEKVSALVFNQG
jgi:hypothetical protein